MKPILFSTPMVRAILDGRKTMTRRVVKTNEKWVTTFGVPKPRYQVGDILYVRETWTHDDYEGFVDYKADCTTKELEELKADGIKWRPSIHMPREAARIFLRVTDVRVERLQEITEDDMIAEGTRDGDKYLVKSPVDPYPEHDARYRGWIGWNRACFEMLWNSTIKPADLDTYGWNANPWVWVYEFERCEKPGGAE